MISTRNHRCSANFPFMSVVISSLTIVFLQLYPGSSVDGAAE